MVKRFLLPLFLCAFCLVARAQDQVRLHIEKDIDGKIETIDTTFVAQDKAHIDQVVESFTPGPSCGANVKMKVNVDMIPSSSPAQESVVRETKPGQGKHITIQKGNPNNAEVLKQLKADLDPETYERIKKQLEETPANENGEREIQTFVVTSERHESDGPIAEDATIKKLEASEDGKVEWTEVEEKDGEITIIKYTVTEEDKSAKEKERFIPKMEDLNIQLKGEPLQENPEE